MADSTDRGGRSGRGFSGDRRHGGSSRSGGYGKSSSHRGGGYRSGGDRDRSGDRHSEDRHRGDRYGDDRPRGDRHNNDRRRSDDDRRRGDWHRDGDRRPPRREGSDRTDSSGVERRGYGKHPDEPLAPLDFDEDALPISVKAELRGVPSDVAHIIEGHLVAAAEALEEDPKLAHEHAQAALRRAARLPVLREVAAETAYAAGEYSSALNDYRALRRMTGNDNLLPVMADCERALGRPQAALKLIREAEEGGPLSSSQQVELVLVKAGARQDLGQEAEARRLLHAAVQSVQASDEAKARLYYGYAEMLLASGDTAGAKSYFASAEELDASELLDAADRLAELSAGPADGADEGADEKIDDQDDQDDKDVQK
ncbi:MAG: hypothetical protein LKI24_16795 [Acidipropionibacterium sp.]|nr:hypothetical protein [Acidipropionibacterium sp.]